MTIRRKDSVKPRDDDDDDDVSMTPFLPSQVQRSTSLMTLVKTLNVTNRTNVNTEACFNHLVCRDLTHHDVVTVFVAVVFKAFR